MTDPYPLLPRNPDSPDMIIFCVGGPKDKQKTKVRFLKNLSGGEYKRDSGLYYGDERLPCYRWIEGKPSSVPNYERYHELIVGGKRMLFIDSTGDIARLLFREHVTGQMFVDEFRWMGKRFERVNANSYGKDAATQGGIDLVRCRKLFEM